MTIRLVDELNDFEKLALIPLSYSRLSSLDWCEAKYFYTYVIKEESVYGPAANFGSAVHAVLEDELVSGEPIERSDAIKYMEVYESRAPEYDETGELIEDPQWLEMAQSIFDDFTIKNEGRKFNIIHKEMPFEIVVGPALIRGFIDRVDIDGNKIHITDYKGLTLDTPIATPTGWTTMGDLAVGDQVYDMYGKPCNVVVKSDIHFNPCYKIVFDDGSSLVADHEHRWVVDTDSGRKVLATEDLARNLINPITEQRHLRIPLTEPIEGANQELPIDPWVLGMWLGDGKHTSGELTWADEAVPDVVNAHGYLLGKRYTKDQNTFNATILGIRGSLKELGLLGNKHIPQRYLRASVEDRRQLLSGLMDSDGSWNKQRNQCVFVNTNEQLALGVCELLASLGIRYSSWKGKAFGFGVETIQYKIAFNPQDWNPFKCSKKYGVNLNPTTKSSRRLIMSVEKVETVPTACIMVDSPSHTFLAGKRMIPTHNTGKWEASKKSIPTNLQLGIYALAVNKLYPDYDVYAELYYLRSGNQKGHLFERDDLWSTELLLLERISELVVKEEFHPTKNYRLCKSCEFAANGVCPTGSKRLRY